MFDIRLAAPSAARYTKQPVLQSAVRIKKTYVEKQESERGGDATQNVHWKPLSTCRSVPRPKHVLTDKMY